MIGFSFVFSYIYNPFKSYDTPLLSLVALLSFFFHFSENRVFLSHIISLNYGFAFFYSSHFLPVFLPIKVHFLSVCH